MRGKQLGTVAGQSLQENVLTPNHLLLLHSAMPAQVTLVASGRLMFFGPPEELVPWFDHLGYKYDPATHGVASDWALDLVAIGFQKPVQLFGHSITSMEQLQAASVQFMSKYRALSGTTLYRDGSTSMMIGTKSLKHKVRARMQKYAGTQVLPASAQQQTTPGLHVFVGAHSSAVSTDGVTPQASTVIGDPVGGAEDMDGMVKAAAESLYQTGWWRQFKACYGREVLAVTRNPADVAGRIMTFTWVAILTGILFYNLPGDATSLQRRLNLVFSNLAFLCLMPYISMSLYTADKKFYLAGGCLTKQRLHQLSCVAGCAGLCQLHLHPHRDKSAVTAVLPATACADTLP